VLRDDFTPKVSRNTQHVSRPESPDILTITNRASIP